MRLAALCPFVDTPSAYLKLVARCAICVDCACKDVLQGERTRLMRNPRSIATLSRLHVCRPPASSTSSVTVIEYTNQLASVRCYPAYLSAIVDGPAIARHERSFERHITNSVSASD